jgi:1-acyl-sn-glycerol-3-phosphate acyltransferase
VVFPEGTRTADGAIGRLQPGILVIAERSGAPVVPAVIEGAFEAWPRGRMIRPHPIAVSYGRPIGAEEYRRLGRGALVRLLRDEMVRLQEELRRRAGRE